MEFIQTSKGRHQLTTDVREADRLLQQALRYIKPCKTKKRAV